MKKLCTILWWDKRDGYGIACDSEGNEHYIDSSSIDQPELCRDGVEVSLEPHMLSNVLCGRNVVISLESVVERQALTVKVLERRASELRPGALDEAKAELSAMAAMLIQRH